MPTIPAFEVGAVLLLAVLFIGASHLRSSFPDLVDNAKRVAMAGAVCLAGFAGYHHLTGLLHFGASGSAASTNAAGTAGLPSAAAASKPSGPTAPKIKITEVEYVVKVPPPATTASTPQPSALVAPPISAASEPAEPEPVAPVETKSRERGAAKIVKSIGRAFRFGRRKHEKDAGEQAGEIDPAGHVEQAER
jgi:hypothetical protein